jgi:hypothetical protein
LLGDEGCNQIPDGNLPPNGKFALDLNGGIQAYLRIGGYDQLGPNYFADVIAFHGIVVKGLMAGVDVNATLFQTPTLKDKTVGQPEFHGFEALGYDVNAQDDVGIGQLCASGNPVDNTNLVQYNNGGAGAKDPINAPCDGILFGIAVAPPGTVGNAANQCVGKPVAIPNRISITMVGDGPSLLDPNVPTGVLGNCPCAPADGIHFSIY